MFICKAIPTLVAVTLVLTGCFSGTPPIPQPPGLGDDIARQCEDLPLVKSSKLDALWANHNETTRLYGECAARHKSAVKHIRNVERITGQK